MAKIPQDYIERCYAGWLGKLIGVRFGIPIEGRNYDYIKKVYGELTDYIDNYQKMLAADDDTNVPIALLSALYDYTHTSDVTAEQMGKTLLNVAPYEHGFFWWGGYGKSTEHTAYTNLHEGVPAPLSGSVEHNGADVAEQIGGQIFIDVWGLIAPGNPKLAAEYAEKAASVTHGGNGVYGDMFVAAAIAAAFTEPSIRKVLEMALEIIPADCEYARVTEDMFRFYDNDSTKDWEAAFAYIKENWGYDRYPGVCHIIPNSAVMVMSMLYGEGDFSRTIRICNMCGWDTDCNVGNVGTIMGTLVGLDGIDMSWRTKSNDVFASSTVIGVRNFLDAPWCNAYIAKLGYRISGEPVPERWAPYLNITGTHYHFEYPGSTHGFTAYSESSHAEDTLQCRVTQTTEDAAAGTGALKVLASPLRANERFRIARRTHFRPEDFHNSRYDPSFSPLVYPGQRIRAKIKLFDGEPCMATIYALDANNNSRMLCAEDVDISAEKWTDLSFDIPAGKGVCIDEIGVSVYLKMGWDRLIAVLVDEFVVEGDADYGIDFTKERNEIWYHHHNEVSQFSYLRGLWRIIDDRLVGTGASYAEAYTGHIDWSDVDFTGTVIPLLPGRAGLGFRIQGAMRSYCAALEDGKLRLLKNVDGDYRVLDEIPVEYKLGEAVTLRVLCKGANIEVQEAGNTLLKYSDKDNPYMFGCIGAILAKGCRAAFEDWNVKASYRTEESV